MRILLISLALSFFCFRMVFPVGTNDLGTVLWTHESSNIIVSSLSVMDQKLYFGNLSDKLYCLNSISGEIIWVFSTGNSNNTFLSSPFYADGKVYAGSYQNKMLYCLDAAAGSKIWSFSAGGEIESSPRVFADKIYFGCWDNKMYCLDAKKGNKIWDFETQNIIRSSPLIINSKIYFGGFDKKFYCLNAADGTKLWEFICGGEIFSSAAFSEGKIYFGCKDGKLYCLDFETGREVWDFKTGESILSSPAVYDGKVYFGSFDNKFYCNNSRTGEKIWEFTTGDDIDSSPCVVEGSVYFGSHDKKFYCLDADKGSKTWELETGDMIESSPCMADGRFYFGNDSGRIYCLDSGSRGIDGGNTLGGQEFFISHLSAVSAEEGNTNENKMVLEESNENITGVIITNYITNYIYITNYNGPQMLPEGNNLVLFNYTIQAGSFTNEKNALKLYNLLKKKGYDVYESYKKIHRKKYYRVRVGKFIMLSDVQNMINKLRDDGLDPVLVKFVR